MRRHALTMLWAVILGACAAPAAHPPSTVIQTTPQVVQGTTSAADGGALSGRILFASASTGTVTVSSTNAFSQYDSQASLNNDQIVARACTFLSAVARNKGASTLYLMFFDSASNPPSNGTTPKWVGVEMPTGSMATINLNDAVGGVIAGVPITTGLVWAASTTADTLTVDTTSSMWVTARFL